MSNGFSNGLSMVFAMIAAFGSASFVMGSFVFFGRIAMHDEVSGKAFVVLCMLVLMVIICVAFASGKISDRIRF